MYRKWKKWRWFFSQFHKNMKNVLETVLIQSEKDYIKQGLILHGLLLNSFEIPTVVASWSVALAIAVARLVIDVFKIGTFTNFTFHDIYPD